MDDKLIELRDAINEYLGAKKFYTHLRQAGDVKILINGATSIFKSSGPIPEDYSLTCEQNIEQIQTMIADIVDNAEERVYQLINKCGDCPIDA